MTKKRKDHASFSEDSVSQKRSCQLNSNDRPIIPPSNQPRIDPTYGQRSAFPDFGTGHGDEKLFYGPASDGLEYLQMVR